jgi:hypothetical protein
VNAVNSRSPAGRVKAAALGVIGVLLTPLPAVAAPAPCGQPQRYAAQSGAQLMRIGGAVTGLGLGETKSALTVTGSAAISRILGGGGLSVAAPPTTAKPGRREIAAATAGPVDLGSGALTSHATWPPGMACGATGGEASRARADIDHVEAVGGLFAVRGKGSSLSTTALERRGEAARTVAAASLAIGEVSVLGGAITIEVVAPPTLLASMSTKDGGEIRYLPAVVQVSGAGFEDHRLDSAGDTIALSGNDSAAELPGLRGLGAVTPLSVPNAPGAPVIAMPEAGAVPFAGPGTTVEVSLGDLRQAASGHAIAAKAVALSVVITSRDTVVLDLDLGLLEVAAVAPEPVTSEAPDASAGTGAGLPVTGPRIDVLGLFAVGLLIVGATALIFGIRGRLGR